jgi:branched-chain amino acid transport system ATP-binding protein
MVNSILALRNVSVSYHGVRALDGVDMDLGRAEVVALMGPNGAGKSTLLKAIFGLVPIDSGSIIWNGKPIPHEPAQLIREGLTFVPQGRRVFPSLSVRENLEMGGIGLENQDLLPDRIDAVLKIFPLLHKRLSRPSGELSGGQQQALALARALIPSPQVLLLDEPSTGLSPALVKEVFSQIQKIHHALGTTILVVEHNLKSLMHIVDRTYLLQKGRVVASGDSAAIHGEAFKNAFLGQEIM